MNNVFVFIACAALAVVLAGCDSNKEGKASRDAPEAVTKATQKAAAKVEAAATNALWKLDAEGTFD